MTELSIDTISEKDSVQYSKCENFWHMLRLSVPNIPPKTSQSRDGIDFVLVIDKSASMAGQKIAQVLASTESIIRNSSIPEDRFAIVTFNHIATQLSGFTSDHDALVKLLHTIQTDGSTNIPSAFGEGYSLLKMSKRQSAMFFFTDGKSNTGMGIEEFGAKITTQTTKFPTTISAFGFGNNCDKPMLKIISQSGMYYYIPENDTNGIASAFGEAVGAIIAMKAWNVHLYLNAQPGCRILETLTEFKTIAVKPAKDYDIFIGAIFSGETKHIPILVSVNKLEDIGPHSLISCTATFYDAHGHKESNILLGTTSISRGPETVPTHSQNHELIENQRERIKVSRAFKVAAEKAVLGNFEEAINVLNNTNDTIHLNNNAYYDLLKRDLDNARDDLEDHVITTSQDYGFEHGSERGGSYITTEQEEQIKKTVANSSAYAKFY